MIVEEITFGGVILMLVNRDADVEPEILENYKKDVEKYLTTKMHILYTNYMCEKDETAIKILTSKSRRNSSD